MAVGKTRGQLSRIEAAAIVLDDEHDVAVRPRQLDFEPLGARMADDIRDELPGSGEEQLIVAAANIWTQIER